jgi:hypothetical protein
MLRRGDLESLDVLTFCTHFMIEDVRCDRASECTAPDARRPKMHAPENAGVGHFFDGKVEPDEGSDGPWHRFRSRVERDVIAEDCAQNCGGGTDQVRMA